MGGGVKRDAPDRAPCSTTLGVAQGVSLGFVPFGLAGDLFMLSARLFQGPFHPKRLHIGEDKGQIDPPLSRTDGLGSVPICVHADGVALWGGQTEGPESFGQYFRVDGRFEEGGTLLFELLVQYIPLEGAHHLDDLFLGGWRLLLCGLLYGRALDHP